MDGTADLTFTFLLTHFCSTSLLRLAAMGLASALSQCGSCLRGLRKQMDGHADWCGFINSPRARSKLRRPCTSRSGLRTELSQT
ncbi:hypothetical protein PO909_019457 [Leuciscus waleckii]